jgi:hypothetical protein
MAQASSLLDEQHRYIRVLKSQVEALWKCHICQNGYDKETIPVTYVTYSFSKSFQTLKSPTDFHVDRHAVRHVGKAGDGMEEVCAHFAVNL